FLRITSYISKLMSDTYLRKTTVRRTSQSRESHSDRASSSQSSSSTSAPATNFSSNSSQISPTNSSRSSGFVKSTDITGEVKSKRIWNSLVGDSTPSAQVEPN